MRPLKLTMQAFGPYANKEVIDFNVLGNRTMFVISGKTGSGKTTIFDGISYAIYGKASGEDRNGPELRSQFAKDSLLTEVKLEFKLRNKQYLIIRTPQQEKKKERGDGYRTIGATAELYAFDENGEKKLVASSIRDVDEKIKEIIQIDSNQFRQILMIPQGEFRKLLTSDSKDKEAILQKLFHTEMYKRVEEKLKEQATGLKKSVEQQLVKRTNRLSHIKSVYHEALQEALKENPENDIMLLPLLEKEIEIMESKLQKMKETLKEKSSDRDKLKQQLFDGENILKQMELRDALGLKKEELVAKQEEYKEKEKTVQLAQKANLLTKQEEICHHLKRQIDKNEASLAGSKQKLADVKRGWELSEQKFKEEEQKEPARKQLIEHLSYLKSIQQHVQLFAEKEKNLFLLSQDLKERETKKSALLVEQKKLEDMLGLFKKEKQQLDKDQLTFLANKERLINVQYLVEKIEKYKLVAQKIDSLVLMLDKREKERTNVQLRYEDSLKLLEKLQRDSHAAQAYFLAESLENDAPCPVCGSTTHPQLASKNAGIFVGEEDIKAAKADTQKLEQEKFNAENAFIKLLTEKTFLEEEKKGWIKEIQHSIDYFSSETAAECYEQITKDAARMKKEQQLLEESIKKSQKAEESLRNIEGQIQNVTLDQEKTNETVQKLSILFAEQQAEIANIKKTIPEELRDVNRYQKAIHREQQELARLENALKEAQKALEKAKELWQIETTKQEELNIRLLELKEQLKQERTIFLENMKQQGFETYSLFMAAKLPEVEIEGLLKKIQAYREEYRSVSDRYQDLYEMLKHTEKPDIEAVKTELDKLDACLQNLQQEQTNLLINIKENKQINDEVTELNEEIKELEEQYKLVGHLYDITRGQNTYRITFERFVLAAFLDDILQEANSRLLKMTSGRYQLVRKADRSKGNVQSGLELLVFDQYTGQERHVKTLSGGESFKAALSLALGLADVVQNYAGGVSLETMFIDEGFGTLDPESLDQAIETLMDIQSTGRLVGIISHVPEIKERMEVRLEVIAGQTGSTTEFRFLT
ncbi:AAA family ATPase [Niallia nealsonii]|uniref:Nuclease SbcCD subunit C n=1 Tax=Niallia nealsonii TaxID=115979 RepID=A0A2N0YYP3_9BACI|nr:SMC family ATPase [Niallia nealsonii]PKG22378.1 ATP-dependent dsDNA exonuclease [Niallia nealsonii]